MTIFKNTHFIFQKVELNENISQRFKLKNMPLISQFYILYWLASHKLQNQTLSVKEYEFVLDTFISHTMGQMFNIRLHAQYMASKLYKINNNNVNSDKYDYIIKVIETTFEESKQDKTFIKLKEDYFANHFDVVKDINPAFIYYYLPKYCELWDVNLNFNYIKSKLDNINDNIIAINVDDFKKEWLESQREINAYNVTLTKNEDKKLNDHLEEVGTIQKKYIPWKNMSDINVYEAGKKVRKFVKFELLSSLGFFGGNLCYMILFSLNMQ